MRISLRVKIMAAFLFLIFISALVISLFTSHATGNAFDRYSTRNRNAWAQRLANNLAEYYTANNGWQGVDSILADYPPDDSRRMGIGNMPGNIQSEKNGGQHFGMMGGMMDDPGQRLLLADSRGWVVFDSSGNGSGSYLSSKEMENGTPVLVDQEQVGTVLVLSGSPQKGTPAGDFLETVNHSLILSILAGAIISVILGVFVFDQITAPLRQLKKAAVEIGNGNFDQRVSIKSRDELADVGNSFNQMAESLEKAREARQHYMADIAHELRTPLTAIQGTIEAMQDKVLSLDDEQLDVLHSQTTLLNRLVDDLRLLSLAEAGQLKLDKASQNPGDLIRQIVDSMKPLANSKQVSMEAEIEENLPACELDKDRFMQIINNLLSNALRYTPQGGAIQVNVRSVPGNRTVEFLITDSGTGIDAQDLPYVFDRFYRADKSRARVSGGAGLGLAIVKQLVEAHNGEISVDSPVYTPSGREGYGTRFRIILPVV